MGVLEEEGMRACVETEFGRRDVWASPARLRVDSDFLEVLCMVSPTTIVGRKGEVLVIVSLKTTRSLPAKSPAECCPQNLQYRWRACGILGHIDGSSPDISIVPMSASRLRATKPWTSSKFQRHCILRTSSPIAVSLVSSRARPTAQISPLEYW